MKNTRRRQHVPTETEFSDVGLFGKGIDDKPTQLSSHLPARSTLSQARRRCDPGFGGMAARGLGRCVLGIECVAALHHCPEASLCPRLRGMAARVLVAACSASSAWWPRRCPKAVSRGHRRLSHLWVDNRWTHALLTPRYAEIEKLCVHPFSPPAPRFKTPELVAVAVAFVLADIRRLDKTSEPVAVAVALLFPMIRRGLRLVSPSAVALLLARYADLDKLRVHPFSPPAPRFKSFEPVAVAVALFLPISADSTTSVSSSSFLPSTPVRRFKTSGRVAVAVAVALLLARYADLDKISAVGNKQVWQDTSQSSSESW
ncbi:hypothetical protein B0H11DRAFT_1939135 [Mycena galericulata]|nr:hypothetical protein B0H11DRAFT_1939135 [Mycena galericulata]